MGRSEDRHRSRTERTLALGGFALLALVGGTIVGLAYGLAAALAALLVIGGGAALLALTWLIVSVLVRWAASE